MKKVLALALGSFLALGIAGGGAMAQTATADGEITKVDKDAKKLTIKHGPISNLNMPGMTMVFQVKDPAVLDQVKAGDKVNFTADRVNGAYTVMSIAKAGSAPAASTAPAAPMGGMGDMGGMGGMGGMDHKH